MKVLITGSNGFIGRNLKLFLQENKEIIVDTLSHNDNYHTLEQKLLWADYIIHLAGVNRPKKESDFLRGNTIFTKTIIDILVKHNLKTPLLYASSTQAALNNPYGKSKLLAEQYIKQNYPNGIIFRFHNVYGIGCEPNYNSVVATFCYNISHNLPIHIEDPEKYIELIYIDDVCNTLIKIILGTKKVKKDLNFIKPVTKIKLKNLAALLYDFNVSSSTIKVPPTGNVFIKNLYSTFLSFLSLDDLPQNLIPRTDERGSFIEILQSDESGQFSFSTSAPGVTRGNHYHHTKIEKFIVIKGEAIVKLRKINTSKIYSYHLTDQQHQTILIPARYTHSITNIGKEEMILLIWSNEIFDKNSPDTFPEPI